MPSNGRNGSARNGSSAYPGSALSVPWAHMHPFLNISITPIECSIICSRELAQKYFAPVIKRGPKDGVSISPEDFIAVSVEGEGLEAGQRVLELTSPLAMAGMYVSISSFPIPLGFVDFVADGFQAPSSSSQHTSPITFLCPPSPVLK